MPSRCEMLCEIILAIVLPPVGVCFRHGCCSVSLSLSLSLSIYYLIPFCLVAEKTERKINIFSAPKWKWRVWRKNDANSILFHISRLQFRPNWSVYLFIYLFLAIVFWAPWLQILRNFTLFSGPLMNNFGEFRIFPVSLYLYINSSHSLFGYRENWKEKYTFSQHLSRAKGVW
jgi:uncharacterized membrane protein YqaE (UPF0057 family)